VTADSTGEGLGAALIQLAGHAERIGSLDAREASHHQDITARLGEVASSVTSLTIRIGAIGSTLSRQDAILSSLDGLDNQVAALAHQLTAIGTTGGEDQDGYQPVPPPRWWKLTGPERQTALDRLTAWVENIYRPSYGRLAAMLPACWQHHPLCLFTLDWLSELWSVLYLSPTRNPASLAGQAEWQTRLLPAAAEQMALDATRCHHGAATTRRLPPHRP
jgi:hypothetical protein